MPSAPKPASESVVGSGIGGIDALTGKVPFAGATDAEKESVAVLGNTTYARSKVVA